MYGSRNLQKAILTDKTGAKLTIALWKDLKDNRKLVDGKIIKIHNGLMNTYRGQSQMSNGPGSTWKEIDESDKTASRLDYQKFAICWPSGEGKEQLEEFIKFQEENKLEYLLWGVNWQIKRDILMELTYPITGYISHKGEIIAIATISGFTAESETNIAPIQTGKPTVDLREWTQARLQTFKQWPSGARSSTPNNYDYYLHVRKIELCLTPFSYKKLTKFDGSEPVEEVQRGVYVNQLNETVPFVDVSEIKDGKTYCEEKILAYLGVEDKRGGCNS
jgi:hypothetical protein